MDVMEAAAAIGLTSGLQDDSFGTVELDLVMDTLTELSLQNPAAIDLFVIAVAAVQSGRSAGVEHIEPGSVFAVRRSNLTVHLRYRREMWNVFADLAIDLALRQRPHVTTVTAPEPARQPAPV
jgi:hypothetical protein